MLGARKASQWPQHPLWDGSCMLFDSHSSPHGSSSPLWQPYISHGRKQVALPPFHFERPHSWLRAMLCCAALVCSFWQNKRGAFRAFCTVPLSRAARCPLVPFVVVRPFRPKSVFECLLKAFFLSCFDAQTLWQHVKRWRHVHAEPPHACPDAAACLSIGCSTTKLDIAKQGLVYVRVIGYSEAEQTRASTMTSTTDAVCGGRPCGTESRMREMEERAEKGRERGRESIDVLLRSQTQTHVGGRSLGQHQEQVDQSVAAAAARRRVFLPFRSLSDRHPPLFLAK